MLSSLKIPDLKRMVLVNERDCLPFYRFPIISWFYFLRIRETLGLLRIPYNNPVLDVGYGSGIIFRELNERFDEIYGIDLHPHASDVREFFRTNYSFSVRLVMGSSLDMPFHPESFGSITCLSVLEHICELDKVVEDLYSVLAPKGEIVVGIPIENWMSNALFKVLQFIGLIRERNMKDVHVSTYDEIVVALEKRFQLLKEKRIPFFIPWRYRPYSCLLFNKDA